MESSSIHPIESVADERRFLERVTIGFGCEASLSGDVPGALGVGQCPAPVTLVGAGRGVVTMGAMSVLIYLFLLSSTPVQTPAAQTPAVESPAPGNPVAVISTSLGDITVELFKDKAPVSVENFLQ